MEAPPIDSPHWPKILCETLVEPLDGYACILYTLKVVLTCIIVTVINYLNTVLTGY